MIHCCFGKKKREEVKRKKKNPEGPHASVRQSQQEIDEDANSSLVPSGSGPKDKTLARNNPTEERKKKNTQEELEQRSTGNSPKSDDSFEDSSKKFGPQASSNGNQGGTVTYNITGKYIQFGKNSTINKYNITNGKNKKNPSSKKGSSSTAAPHQYPKFSTDSNSSNAFPSWPLQEFPQPSQGNLKALYDKTDAVYNQRLLVNLASSIGIIRSPSTSGTGFRVGPNYVMTAKHVIDGILKAVPVPIAQQQQPKYIYLRDSNVHIDFSYELTNQPVDENFKFFFDEIVFENQDLDVAILRLQPCNNDLPPPIINFSELKEMEGDLYFIGHSRADIKKIDNFSCVQHHPMNVISPGFEGIENPCCQLLHCTFEKGASGAPGVWISPATHMPYVVLMLLRGYPYWFYDDKTPQEIKSNMHPNDRVEQGVCMKAIYNELMKINPSLCQEIFAYRPTESPTYSCEDVEMKSLEN